MRSRGRPWACLDSGQRTSELCYVQALRPGGCSPACPTMALEPDFTSPEHRARSALPTAAVSRGAETAELPQAHHRAIQETITLAAGSWGFGRQEADRKSGGPGCQHP